MILNRTEKAERIVERGGVTTRHAPEIEYTVMGDRGVEYIVTFYPETGEFTCTCPDHVYRERECKHIKAVKMAERPKPIKTQQFIVFAPEYKAEGVEQVLQGLVKAGAVHRYSKPWR